jgi:hypothetical protein
VSGASPSADVGFETFNTNLAMCQGGLFIEWDCMIASRSPFSGCLNGLEVGSKQRNVPCRYHTGGLGRADSFRRAN